MKAHGNARTQPLTAQPHQFFKWLHWAASQILDENSLTLLFEDHNGNTDHTMEFSTKWPVLQDG